MTDRDPPTSAGLPAPSFRQRTAFVLRYVVMQLPDLALLAVGLVLLHDWLGLSYTVGAVVVVLWIVKCIAFYPLVDRVYRQAPVSRDPAAGSLGVVRHRLAPTGYAAFAGELWRCVARPGAAPVEKGTVVRVVRTDGLTLVVEGAAPADADRLETPDGNR